jgi:hypothetical protein
MASHRILLGALDIQRDKMDKLEAQVKSLRKQLKQAREPKTVVKVLPPVRMPGPKQDAPFGVFTVPSGYKYLAGWEDDVWAFSTFGQVQVKWGFDPDPNRPDKTEREEVEAYKKWVGELNTEGNMHVFYFVEVQ